MALRHCTIKQTPPAGEKLLAEVVLGAVTLAFDADGTARERETGQAELPEAVGLSAERRPQRYAITWHDGPRPSNQGPKVPRASVARRLEPPTREEAIAAGVAPKDAGAAVAFQRYLAAQQVFPYGLAPLPPQGAEKMLERFLAEERKRDQGGGEEKPFEGQEKPFEGQEKKTKVTHYQRRADELAEMRATDAGVEALRALAERYGIASVDMAEVVDLCLAREFPRDHKKAK